MKTTTTSISNYNFLSFVKREKKLLETKMDHYNRIISILQHKDNNIHHLYSLRKTIDNFENFFKEDCILSINLWQIYYQLQAELL